MTLEQVIQALRKDPTARFRRPLNDLAYQQARAAGVASIKVTETDGQCANVPANPLWDGWEREPREVLMVCFRGNPVALADTYCRDNLTAYQAGAHLSVSQELTFPVDWTYQTYVEKKTKA